MPKGSKLSIEVDGKIYPSLSAAAAETGLSPMRLREALASGEPFQGHRVVLAGSGPAGPCKEPVQIAASASTELDPLAIAPRRPSDALRAADAEPSPLITVADLLARLAGKGLRVGRVSVLTIESIDVGAA